MSQPSASFETLREEFTALFNTILINVTHATYDERQVRAVPAELLDRYFESGRRPVLLPEGPASVGHLRPKRPGARRADLKIGLLVCRNALLASPLAHVVVTADGLIALCNRQTETLFGVSNRDVGRPFSDVALSYRPVELRRYTEQAHLERRTMRVADIAYLRGAETLHLEVQNSPLTDADAGLLGVNPSFHDVTVSRRLREELQQANHSWKRLTRICSPPMTSSMSSMMSYTTEPTTNRAKHFLETMLTGLRSGVAVLDPEMRVLVWNQRAEDLWGLRKDEAVGQHFLNLDIGLPTQELRPLMPSCSWSKTPKTPSTPMEQALSGLHSKTAKPTWVLPIAVDRPRRQARLASRRCRFAFREGGRRSVCGR